MNAASQEASLSGGDYKNPEGSHAAMHTPDAQQLRAALASPNERTRAVAARAACPCHGSFNLLRELQPELEFLARHDPSPRVRKAARHALGDALNVNIHEDAHIRRQERREDGLAHSMHKARVRAAAQQRKYQARKYSARTQTDIAAWLKASAL